MKWLENKVVFIAGAGEGIGKVVVKRFLEEGAAGVVAFDIVEERLDALQAAHGDRVATVCGDVRSLADNPKAVELAVSKFGRLDVFIGNAGVRDGRKRLEDMGEKELTQGFDDVFGVNVKGYMIGAAAAREELVRARAVSFLPCRHRRFMWAAGRSIPLQNMRPLA